jgi:hypothetical protein
MAQQFTAIEPPLQAFILRQHMFLPSAFDGEEPVGVSIDGRPTGLVEEEPVSA